MLISIITPTLNSDLNIHENVRSVISQTYSNFEHIIIDNLSSDKTLETIKKLYVEAGLEEKLKIISEKDDGIADAFNKGINAASGEIITILNSDDAFYDQNILQDVRDVLINKNKLIAHGDICFIDEVYGSNIRQPLNSKVIGTVFNHPGMFLKKEVYSETGLYDTNFRYSMDFEYYCRLLRKYEGSENISVYMGKPLVKMTAGGASWDNEVKSIKEIKRAMKIHGLWNIPGIAYYSGRILRARLKKLITAIGLNSIVQLWRKLKWKG